jgi:hypothetical protein
MDTFAGAVLKVGHGTANRSPKASNAAAAVSAAPGSSFPFQFAILVIFASASALSVNGVGPLYQLLSYSSVAEEPNAKVTPVVGISD